MENIQFNEDFVEETEVTETETSKKRSRAYHRHHRRRVINRKKEIAKRTSYYFQHAGVFDKGKVHCSCGYCNPKYKTHGPKLSDLKKLEYQKEELVLYS